jgi:hypothetical protein
VACGASQFLRIAGGCKTFCGKGWRVKLATTAYIGDGRGGAVCLRAEEVGVQASVVVFGGPEGERDRGKVVDERDGVAVFR